MPQTLHKQSSLKQQYLFNIFCDSNSVLNIVLQLFRTHVQIYQCSDLPVFRPKNAQNYPCSDYSELQVFRPNNVQT